MAAEMKPSAEVRAFIQAHEGLRLAVYCCPGGEWTQGWGHTKGVTADSPPITVEMAKRWLDEDLQAAAAIVRKHVRVPLEQGQFDALVSIVFNIGPGLPGVRDGIVWLKRRAGGGLATPSTLLSKLNACDYAGAANEFHRWKYSAGKVLSGLVKRRAEEAAMFQGRNATTTKEGI